MIQIILIIYLLVGFINLINFKSIIKEMEEAFKIEELKEEIEVKEAKPYYNLYKDHQKVLEVLIILLWLPLYIYFKIDELRES